MRFIVVAVLMSLGACSVGEVPIGGGGGADASTGGTDSSVVGDPKEQAFTAMIKPLVSECAGCHSGATAPNLSSFAVLEAKYKMKPGAQNILVTKGALTGGVHQGLPYFSEAEQTTIAAFIDNL